MNELTIPSNLLELWRSRNRDALWAAYKAEWSASEVPPMDSAIFSFLFSVWPIAREAKTLALHSRHARETMREGARWDPEVLLNNENNCLALLSSLLDTNEIVELWNQRGKQTAEDRCKSTHSFVEVLVKMVGRARARQEVSSLWADHDLLEEERETILRSLGRQGALSRDFVHQLGPDAEELILRVFAQDSRDRSNILEPTPKLILQAAPEVAERMASLLRSMGIPIDLRNASLSTAELERLKGGGWASTVQALHRRFDRDVVAELEQILLRIQGNLLGAGSSVFLIPLIRVLHMRLILEAPSLVPAVARPEESLIPEVLLYVLGRDAVDYVPELRVHAGMDRRWRAKWAEITGEALSVLFLEEALGLDLTTLRRIEERPGEETPDFQASTMAGEQIVFESKGSTDSKTHRRQRTKALRQLKKHSKRERGANSWKEPGRAYACCLFTAQQGTDESTLLHVADPPFAFRDLFREGWELEARRRHYAAVAEAAGLFELADIILRRERREEGRGREPETFRLELEGRSEDSQFTGTSTWLRDQARRLGHPRPEVFDRVRMFTGLSTNLFWRLMKGEIPRPYPPEESSFRYEPEQPFLPSSGTLSDPERPESARGVFSFLPDGSFLAFEVV